MNNIGIDCATKDVNNLMRRLSRLKNVESVETLGMYHQDTTYTKLSVITSMTEDEVENWLYKNNFDYVGTFVIEWNFSTYEEH